MPHFEVHNHTRFAYESLVLNDEEGMPQFVPLVQATFAIDPVGGALSLLEEQLPIDVGGQWYGDPATTSVKSEPQIAFLKLATDVVLHGHACATQANTTQLRVGIRIGSLTKLVRVVGDRFMVRRGGAVSATEPRPFEKIPLIYERAFGGWDRRSADEREHRCEARNPVGVGFRIAALDIDDQTALPNIEYEDQPLRAWGDTPDPAGFGFMAPNWQPRAAFAGTYDAAWDTQRKPLLPLDFDRRFFNAASPGLIAPSYLRGDESVVVIGASTHGRVAFDLPGVAPPECVVEVRGRRRISLMTVLDTVVIDMDELSLSLTWRAHLPLRNGPHDVLRVALRSVAT
jgi:hypothetical protein